MARFLKTISEKPFLMPLGAGLSLLLAGLIVAGFFVSFAKVNAFNIIKLPYKDTIGPFSDEGGFCGSSARHPCPSETEVVCGMKGVSGQDNKGTIKANQLLCCELSGDAKKFGIQRSGSIYSVDEDSKGSSVYCNPSPGCHDKNEQPPRDALIGGNKWAKNQQLDFGACQPLSKTDFTSVRLVTVTQDAGTVFMCGQDEVACGGKNAPKKNDSWNGFYCCKVEPSKGTIIVRAYKEEEPNTDLAIPFSLRGAFESVIPGATWQYDCQPGGSCTCSCRVSPFTTYQQRVLIGTYTLTVPTSSQTLFGVSPCDGVSLCQLQVPSVPTMFLGYSCRLVNRSAGAEQPCTAPISGLLEANQTLELDVIFSKSCKTCANVVASGALCGSFFSGCEKPGEPPSLQCGSCTAPKICSAQGRCILRPLTVSCTADPPIQAVGGPVEFTGYAGGTGPFSCVWSGNPQVDGETTCGSFTASFAAPGTYTATFEVTDKGETPPRTLSGICSVDILPPASPGTPPNPNVPEADLCEAYTFVQRYGIPIDAVMILVSGVYVLTSLGNPNRLKKGKAALTASVVGLAVLIFAKPIFVALMSFLGFKVLLCGTIVP